MLRKPGTPWKIILKLWKITLWKMHFGKLHSGKCTLETKVLRTAQGGTASFGFHRERKTTSRQSKLDSELNVQSGKSEISKLDSGLIVQLGRRS